MHDEFLGTIDWCRVRALYRLDALDRAAARLAKEIEGLCAGQRSSAEAFAARLNVGGQVARLVGHDSAAAGRNLDCRTGLRDLRTAYPRFETHTGPRAQEFVDQILA